MLHWILENINTTLIVVVFGVYIPFWIYYWQLQDSMSNLKKVQEKAIYETARDIEPYADFFSFVENLQKTDPRLLLPTQKVNNVLRFFSYSFFALSLFGVVWEEAKHDLGFLAGNIFVATASEVFRVLYIMSLGIASHLLREEIRFYRYFSNMSRIKFSGDATRGSIRLIVD